MPRTKRPRVTIKAAFRLARALYDEFGEKCAEGTPFQIADFEATAAEKLKGFTTIAYEGFVHHICETIDRAHVREDDPEQITLFDMGRVLKLGDGHRIPSRYATIQHYDESLALDDANLAAVAAANARKHQVRDLLAPYWPMPLSMADALAAYRAEHPEGEEEEP